jgi:hypothetical protein
MVLQIFQIEIALTASARLAINYFHFFQCGDVGMVERSSTKLEKPTEILAKIYLLVKLYG